MSQRILQWQKRTGQFLLSIKMATQYGLCRNYFSFVIQINAFFTRRIKRFWHAIASVWLFSYDLYSYLLLLQPGCQGFIINALFFTGRLFKEQVVTLDRFRCNAVPSQRGCHGPWAAMTLPPSPFSIFNGPFAPTCY